MAGHYRGEPVASGLTRATVASPAQVARRRARRQRIVWMLALLAVVVAAVWSGYLVWNAYFPVVQPVSDQLTP